MARILYSVTERDANIVVTLNMVRILYSVTECGTSTVQCHLMWNECCTESLNVARILYSVIECGTNTVLYCIVLW